MKSLQVLNLGGNGFSHVENGIWEILGNLCNFIHLDLSYNQIREILELPVNISRCISYSLESLDLSGNNIMGNLPSILGQLTNLKQLDFSYNKLSGEIPDCLGQLTEIEYLDISSNFIQGQVSLSHLGSLSKLSYLDMSYNNVSLDVNSNWLPPSQLNKFRMASCNINHSPHWLQTQTRIQDLDLSNTGISGEPHEWFINTSSFLRLNLANNFLTGPLPKQLSLGRLEYDEHASFIDLSSNQFSGSIPLTFERDCAIYSLQLNNNSLTGHIPSSLMNCPLEILDLSSNRLSGEIPPWTSYQLLGLRILRLQNNQLGEVNPRDDSGNSTTILKSLCKLSLQILDLQKNKLSGTIPNCWEYSESLQVINLSSNNLSSVIPCSLGNLFSLKYLHLSDNKLYGHIPSCLSNLTQLKILNLGGNDLSGAIPKWFDTSFPSLEVLRLPQNKFNGLIPKKFCNFSHLRVMDLSNNQLTGKIPPCFGNLVGMNLPVNTSDDDLLVSSDMIPDNNIRETVAGIAREYSSVLNYLVNIDLSNNNLVGVVPKELTKLFV
ncbi:probable LRR receptor-like serine/threonine-protein kinase At4g36180 [Chenopodium quinoa]|uniref:probable LRR receptor-like serine/threonine-protein kinase At4g36180 n=1 Tax=Chenopodium quinoa TaxID=63459 RepID=UPI000B775294|nr:probable LRR receptor-like serine/threonine-protein kinase At4g36180 [Chenopodium quinoa]